MNKIIAALSLCCVFCGVAHADYYRRAGGGYYELYVNDCSKSGMRRAMDNAVAEKKAVITRVICAANMAAPVAAAQAPVAENANVVAQDAFVESDVFVENNYFDAPVIMGNADWDSLPIVDFCPCHAATVCGYSF